AREQILQEPATAPQGADELERSIAALAIDSYPAFLLSPDETLQTTPFSVVATVAVSGHPKKDAFCDGVLRDPVLKQIFVRSDRHTGHWGRLTTNTGMGGTLQLSMLPEVLLHTAWRNLDVADASPTNFAAEAINALRFARAVISGATRNIT